MDDDEDDPFLAQMAPSAAERRDQAVEGCFKFLLIIFAVPLVLFGVIVPLVVFAVEVLK